MPPARPMDSHDNWASSDARVASRGARSSGGVTTVYLDRAAKAALERMARETRRPQAVLIREAIAKYTGTGPRPPLRSLGVAHGPRDLATRTEELLADGFGGAERRRRARR